MKRGEPLSAAGRARLWGRLLVWLLGAALWWPWHAYGAALPNHKQFINVGYVPAPGYIQRDSRDLMSGMVYDYFESLGTYLDKRLIYVPCTADQCQSQLLDGTIDVWANIPFDRNGPQGVLMDASKHVITKLMLTLYLNNTTDLRHRNGQLAIGFCERYLQREHIIVALKDDNLIEGRDFFLLPYSDEQQLYEEFYRKTLNGIMVSPGQRRIDSFARTLERTYMKNTYYAVRKGNFEVLSELDGASDRLLSIRPTFRERLYDKHLNSQIAVTFTAEEQEYIRNKKKLVVVADPAQRPFSYFHEGEYLGVYADILNEIGQRLGLYIDVLSLEDYDEAVRSFSGGQADLYAGFYYDFNWGHQNSVKLSLPYLTVGYLRVTRKDMAVPERPRVACPARSYFVHANVERMFDREQILYYDNFTECLRAVEQGIADVTFAPAAAYNVMIESGGFYQLATDANIQFSHDCSFALREDTDPLLISVLNKALANLNQDTVQSIISRNANDIDLRLSISLMRMIYTNPVEFSLGVAAMLAVVIMFLFYILLMRRVNLRRMWELAYIDSNVRMKNRRWLNQNLMRLADLRYSQSFDGSLYLMLLRVQNLERLRESYDSNQVYEGLRHQMLNAMGRNPWVQELCVASDRACCYALADLPDGTDAVESCAKLCQDASLCELDGLVMHLNFSAGVVEVPRTGEIDVDVLLRQAESVRQRAQVQGVMAAFYDGEQAARDDTERNIEKIMEIALRRKEFKVWLQPKYELTTHQVIGAEALVRWESMELGFLGPDKFIPLFEKNGFVLKLDYYMVEQVCRMQSERLREGKLVVPISVNQSGLHMTEDSYLEKLREICERCEMKPGTLELELTETALVDFSTKDSRTNSRHIIDELHAMGFELSMDDFCTGYSSLAMLQNFPMEVMKIDRSLLVTAETSDRARDLLRSVVDLGNNLNMLVICEGIETPEQERMLIEDCGCRYGQGMMFARPMPMEVFGDYLESKDKLGKLVHPRILDKV